MALDEPREDDQTFDLNGINTIVNNDLLARAEEINIDFVEAGFRSGFSITTKAPVFTGGPSACGTSCSCWAGWGKPGSNRPFRRPGGVPAAK